MTPLGRIIAGLIDAAGPLPVGEYMAVCLSDPRHGYYSTREPFGKAGDFVTAPEISQMFGELVGAWLSAAWQASGSPASPVIAEIGPGRGTLMKDVARTLARIGPDLRNGASFHLIETSQKLAQAQAKTLEGSGGRFDWHSGVEDLPRGRPLFIVGNEIFDAIPMRQYVKTAQGWRERVVTLVAGERLAFGIGPGSIDPGLLPAGHANAPQGTVFEAAPARSALMQMIAERIAADGGCGLFFDYGHLEPGFGDTFQALHAHRPAHVLDNPGEADLTSHVDFHALAAVARAAGLSVRLATQGEFLLRLGLLERAGRLGAAADDARRAVISGEVERLAGPEQMGALFKVLAVAPEGATLPGF
ncbi:MAG: class I SAM-dependent methyltransferase [Rhizobiaceae bacterium]|nr:class I SAM-dependent methyltransferase [Rhizobiaceae bacterium]